MPRENKAILTERTDDSGEEISIFGGGIHGAEGYTQALPINRYAEELLNKV